MKIKQVSGLGRRTVQAGVRVPTRMKSPRREASPARYFQEPVREAVQCGEISHCRIYTFGLCFEMQYSLIALRPGDLNVVNIVKQDELHFTSRYFLKKGLLKQIKAVI